VNRWHVKIRELLELMRKEDASDLHITVGLQPYIRVDGKIIPTGLQPISEEDCELMLYSLLNDEQIQTFKKNRVLDCSYGEKSLGRFRLNIYKQRGTTTAAIRRLPNRIPTMQELNLPDKIIKRLCDRPYGLVIVAGPVGSGKTTTLASMTQYINNTRNCHILCVEDPIEYIHSSAKSLIHQREIHTDTLSFADALKYGLREDPDVLVVGEMRDLETISSAVTIAETGHLVLATLHTGNAGESISRIVDVFSPVQQAQVRVQLSTCLAGVLNQILLPTKDGKGRILAMEVMVATPAIGALIRANKIESIYTQMQIGGKFGMKTMNMSLVELVANGKISKELAVAKAPRPKELLQLLEDEL
jgi:twitching motility protein PilT